MSTTVSRRSLAAVGLTVSLLTTAAPPARAQSVATSADTAPPVAARIPKVDTLHGEIRVDDYFWLRHKSDSAVIHYLEAENAWTEASSTTASTWSSNRIGTTIRFTGSDSPSPEETFT